MTIKDQNGNVIGSNLGNNIYEYDSYSGSQIQIMFGDILIDNAVGVSFQANQSKTPIFGYASPYYSFMADGHIMVQGSLVIGFKEAGYLLYPTQKLVNSEAYLKSSQTNGDFQPSYPELSTSPRYSLDSNGNIINSYTPKDFSLTEASNAAKRKKVMRGNVEQMLASDVRNAGSSEEQPRNRKVFSSFWNELSALPDDEFEDWAEVYEDAIWYGSEKNNSIVRDKLFSKNIKSGTRLEEEDVLQHRRLDQYPEFDIWIVYGDMSRQPSNHTVRKLLDVSFLGQSQTIEVSGEPILEQYTFIARNLI